VTSLKEGHGPHFTAKMVMLVPNRPQSWFTIETLKSAVITKNLQLFALRLRRGKTAETAETAGFYMVF
jgi:hypothetical protein